MERLTSKALFRHHGCNPNSAAQTRRTANKWPSTVNVFSAHSCWADFGTRNRLARVRSHLGRQEPKVRCGKFEQIRKHGSDVRTGQAVP